ncbi:hypothetical protein DERP_000263 [Dermatophagoides pteronyssinus]|uniref:Uncharacterized protein n=1 Tax=Dermatophagoides pteronyssinus TaxID=6956 RepID=A0ABQ8IZS7_DERPT|nr:hypothetical protein DERP_000263 [Dermatophagoides pteronyssinus]
MTIARLIDIERIKIFLPMNTNDVIWKARQIEFYNSNGRLHSIQYCTVIGSGDDVRDSKPKK